MWLRLVRILTWVTYAESISRITGSHWKNMTKARTQLVDLRHWRLAYEAVLESCAGRLPDAAHLPEIVRRRLGGEALWSAARAYDRGCTGQIPVDDLVEFAFDCWPEAGKLPVYRRLRLRQGTSARSMPCLQPFILSAVAHKVENWW